MMRQAGQGFQQEQNAISSTTKITRKQYEQSRLTTTIQQSREIKALIILARKFDKVFTRSPEHPSFQCSAIFIPPPLLYIISSRRLVLPSKNFHKSQRSRRCHFAWKSLLVHATSTCHSSQMESRGTLVSLLQMKQATGQKLL